MSYPTPTLVSSPVYGARPSFMSRLLTALNLGKTQPFAATEDTDNWEHDQFSEHRSLDEDLAERRGQLRDRHFF